MAKESMKAREVKRAKLVARYAEKRAALKKVIATASCNHYQRMQIQFVYTTVVKSQDVLKAISVNSESHVFNSVKWLQQV